jgi:hypothetical protein
LLLFESFYTLYGDISLGKFINLIKHLDEKKEDDMAKIKVYPSNKEFFVRSKAFCEQILDMCDKIGITPVAWGGLAYFGYTKDKNAVIKDIDLLIPEDSFKKIIKVLEKNKIKYKYFAKWHSIQAFNKDLKIDLDSMDYWYKGPKTFKDFDFDGLRVKTLGLEALAISYKEAGAASKDKPEEYHKKFEALKQIK